MSRLGDVAAQPFDVVVIGGGINGAGIAREATLAGYRTLLVDRNDFASGTTSRATRLIHGGLRYLEHRELGLVYESLGEREALVRDAPHLVRPLRLLVPVYRGDARRPWKVRAGLMLYDALSFRKSLPAHRSISRRKLAQHEPKLTRDGLSALYAFSDAQVEFPERLVIESVRELLDAGGVALNHAEVTGLASPGGILRGVIVRDAFSGETAEIRTKVVVNAAGPWVDQVLAGSDAERHEPLIGGTKGSHLVARWPDGPTHAVFAMAKADGRPFFVLPWYRYTLIGTTDLHYRGDPSDARATPEEVQYLLDEAARLFPDAPLRREDVLYTYSGVRPLPYAPHEPEAAITRRHLVIDHVKRGGPTGLLTVVGGKLTTYRSLARLALPAIAKHVEPSQQREVAEAREAHAGHTGSIYSVDNPLALYGRRGRDVLAHIESGEPERREPLCRHNPEVLGQVSYAVEHEAAMTLADVLLRRLPCGWSECHALDGAARAAAVMAKHFGWDAERTAREVTAYEQELRETLVPLDAIEHATAVSNEPAGATGR
jgi:glycerol-3-phosphate dehydrogenase